MHELFNATASFWYAFHVLSEPYQFLRVRFQSQSIFLVCYSYLLQTVPIIPFAYPGLAQIFWYAFPVLSEPYQFTSQHPSGLILIVGTFLLFITSHTKVVHTGTICHSGGCSHWCVSPIEHAVWLSKTG